MAFGLSAAAIGGIATAGLGAYTAYKGSKNTPSQATTTQQQQADPRISGMLFGQNGNNGLLNQFQGYLDKPQSAGMQQYGQAAQNYLGNSGAYDLANQHNAAMGLMNGGHSAPAQTNMDLSGAYDRTINGDPAANPYLTGAIAKGINQSTTAFQNQQTDATRNLTENVLPSLRGGAIAAGQYGGTRQGLAEGMALNSFNTQQGRALSQFGQNNTDAAVSAQAGAYDNGQSRALAAMNSVGGQQQASNALQSSNTQAGLQASNGLLNNIYTAGANQDSYGINQAGKVSGLLSPYLGVNGTQTTSQPLYQNQGANILGGATAGLGIYNGLKNSGLFGDKPPTIGSSADYANNNWLTS
jgi:hypothetical protein